MPKFHLTVRRQKIDQEEAHTQREHFSQTPEDQYMSDGGETFGRTGLGNGDPDIMRAWTIEYSEKLEGSYGTVQQILYAARKGVFERAVVSLAMQGTVDLVIRDGKIEDGPNWATMDTPIALVTLRHAVKRGLRQIITKLPKAPAHCIEELLKKAESI